MKRSKQKEPVVASGEVTAATGEQKPDSIQASWSTDPATRLDGKTYLVCAIKTDGTNTYHAQLIVASWNGHDWVLPGEVGKGVINVICWLLVPNIPAIAEERATVVMDTLEEHRESERHHVPEDVVEEEEFQWPGAHPEED